MAISLIVWLMKESNFERLVLQYVGRSKYKPVKARILARNLEIPKEQHDEFKRFVKGMVNDGKLAYGENHKIIKGDSSSSSTGPKSTDLIGKFQRKSAGFGFVRPADAKPGSRDGDIYIPARQTRDATTGDTVRVRVHMSRRGKNFKLSGEIVEVLERGTNQFVGVYLEEDGKAFVKVDGSVFDSPVHVGDPGAKSAQPDDKVVIEMVKFPTGSRVGEAVITDVLGAAWNAWRRHAINHLRIWSSG